MESLDDAKWWELMSMVEDGECTPFIGPEVYDRWIPSSVKLAEQWARNNKYPLQDTHVLAKVAQFLAIKNSDGEMGPKRLLSKELKKIRTSPEMPNFSSKEHENTAYSVLADLPFPIYITTNYDDFMEEALRRKNREPVSDFCRWKPAVERDAESLDFRSEIKGASYKLDKSHPLVYHLHGIIDVPRSMVLTEKDYIEFVLNLNVDYSNLVPAVVRNALSLNRLLFIGYNIEDLTFRVNFQGISNLLRADRSISYAVQLPPDPNLSAQEYLNSYTTDMFRVIVYWSKTQQFVEELRRQWYRFQSGSEKKQND